MSDRKPISIRSLRPEDREIVRRLCCDTGFLGNPIDPVFEDRTLFADFLTAYYTDAEPESGFVLEVEGEVRGYLLGSRHPDRQRQFNRKLMLRLVKRVLTKYWTYNAASRRFIHWILFKGWRQTPESPKDTPHFHINLLPDARNVASTRALMDGYLKYLRENGETHVYGQMVTYEGRRGSRMFERYGFQVLNKMEITKYRRLHPEPVYLCTVLKDLRENDQLYARPGSAGA